MAPVNQRRVWRLAPGRGFTLLELLLAVAVLAVIAVLIAALMGQARSWDEANGSQANVMRVSRVTELLNRQWSDRRTAVSIGNENQRVIAKPKRLEFITASPVLHPGWPLVQASYVLERDPNPPAGLPAGEYFAMVYEEARISRLGEATGAERLQMSSPSTDDERPARRELLRGLTSARFERFGPEFSPEEMQRNKEQGGGFSEDPESKKNKWRVFDREFSGPISAVRLIARKDGQEFACVFVIELSR